MGRNDDQIRCSFCNKSQAQVKKLIAGPNDTYICDECVEVCSEIIEEEMAYDENDSWTPFSLPPFLLTCGTGRVEDGEEGDADVGENGLPEAGEPDDAKDHEQPLDAERHDDVLPDDYAGLGGDGEHFR